MENLDISFGGRKSFYLDGIPDDGKTWTFKDDVPLGATTAEIEDGDGNTETVTKNPAGLFKTGTSLYQESANSGTSMTICAGEYGVTITPGALEMSNVDVADEFANMIITQRGFQSNSKIITVGDEMVKTAIDMKQ